MTHLPDIIRSLLHYPIGVLPMFAAPLLEWGIR